MHTKEEKEKLRAERRKQIAKELKKRIKVEWTEDGYAPSTEAFADIEPVINAGAAVSNGAEAEEWSDAKKCCKEINDEIDNLAEEILKKSEAKGVDVKKIPPAHFNARAKEFEEEHKEKLKITYPNQSSGTFQ